MASAGRLTEDAAARLSKQYRSEIAHRYSYEFTRWMARPVRLVLDRFFLSEVIVGGFDHILTMPKDTYVILSCVHKSHLDYIVLGHVLFSNMKSLPATIAGKNLFHGLFEGMLPRFKGVCLDREKVNPKNLRSRENLLYLSTFYDYLMDEVMNRGDAITIFPEAGRSYDGSIQPLALGVFGIAKRALKEGTHRVALLPVGMTYDRVTEDERFHRMREQKAAGADAYRAYDKRGFIRHAIFQPKGAVYVDFGEPMYVKDVKYMDELERELRTRMGRLIRVTAVALVCRALAGRTSVPMDDLFRHIRADLKYAKDNCLLIGRGVSHRSPGQVFKRALEHLCNRVRFRDAICIHTKDSSMYIRVKRADIIDYYANTVKHLFPAG